MEGQEGVQDGGEPGGEWAFEGAPEGGYTELEQTNGVNYAPEAVQHFSEFVSGLNGGKGLSQTDLQAIFSYESDRMKEAGDLQQSQLATLYKGWNDDIRNDPVLGGENLPASNRLVLYALSEGGPLGKVGVELLAEMRSLGIQGNNKLFRALHALGKMTAEDGTFTADGSSGAGGATTPDLARTYPSMKHLIQS